MPKTTIFDDTAAFAEHADCQFKKAFESDEPPLPSTSSFNKQPDIQQLKIKRLEAENKTLRQNLEAAEARLTVVLAENSKLKETIEESKELANVSPIKQESSSKPALWSKSVAKQEHPVKSEKAFKQPNPINKQTPVPNQDAFLKSYKDEIKMLRLKLRQYEDSNENLDTTRIVRFVPSNPLDKALASRGKQN